MRTAVALTVVAAALAACDSPSLSMAGANRAQVDVGGMTFGVHYHGTQAEVLRLNRQWRPSWAEVSQNATIAVQQVTGCRVAQITGDPALMKATLDCR
jgi:hypothetical protein